MLSDRFRLSLHVAARQAGLGQDAAETMVRVATRELVPSYTVLLDIDHATHCRRIAERGHQALARAEFDMTRQYFDEAFDSVPAPKIRLDTSVLTLDEVPAAVVDQLPALGGARCDASS